MNVVSIFRVDCLDSPTGLHPEVSSSVSPQFKPTFIISSLISQQPDLNNRHLTARDYRYGNDNVLNVVFYVDRLDSPTDDFMDASPFVRVVDPDRRLHRQPAMATRPLPPAIV